ncbi:MAG: bifunctional metallophosphatase/5'-nucleotidase [Candidatus Bruticola sp.]
MQINGFSSMSLAVKSGIDAGRYSGISTSGSNCDNEQIDAADLCSISKEVGNICHQADTDENIRHLRIIHLNDLHGAALPEDGRGGLAQVAAVVKREKAEMPESSLVLNAGDIAEGTMISYLSEGSVVSESLAQMGCDAIEPGNHDFAWGQATMRSMLGQTNAPVVCANLEQAEGHEFAQPYIIREVNGVKVGILGLSTDISNFTTDDKIEGLQYKDPVATAKQYVPQMRQDGAELVVALSHLGIEQDRFLAANCPDINVIVGGHTHTELPEGEYVNDTLIVQSGYKGQFVGEVDLEFDIASRRIVNTKAELISVDSSNIAPDPEVAEIVNKFVTLSNEVAQQPMGQALERLTYSHSECAKLDQIHADSLRQAMGTEIGLVNGRNLRANVEAGEVTYENLFNALPHTEDDAVLMKLPGSLLKEALEHRVAGRLVPASPSGFSYTYDLSKPVGERITSITMDDGSEFNPHKIYNLATSVSLSDKKMFDKCEKKNMGSAQKMFMDYFKAGSPWRNDPDNRVCQLN